MATLEQEGTLVPDEEKSRDSSSHSQASGVERLSREEWSKLTRSQKRNLIRRRALASKSEADEHQRAGGSGKRPRDEAGFTPSPNKEERKKPKTEAPKYSHILSCLKVAILPKGHPKEELSEVAGNKLALKLVQHIKTHDPKEGMLTFCGFVVRNGALIINCADERSKQWITKSAQDLSPWEGMQLKTCDPKDLEGFVRITAFAPNPVEGIEGALTNIKIQGSIDTSKWRILPKGVKVQENGLFFVASIPESHYKELEARKFRISCGLHLIEIRKLNEKPARKPASTAGPEKKEVRRVGYVAETGAEIAAVDEPSSEAAAVPDCYGSKKWTKGPRKQQPEDQGKPATGGGRQDAVSGPGEGTSAVGMNLDFRGQTGSDPPPS